MYEAIGRSYRTEQGQRLVWLEGGCDGRRFEVFDPAKEILHVACELGHPASGVSFARSVDGHLWVLTVWSGEQNTVAALGRYPNF